MLQKTVIILVGHGSDNKESNLQFEEIAYELRQRFRPALLIHAYLEKAKPSFEDVLFEMSRTFKDIVVFPMLLFNATHSRNDIPGIVDKVLAQQSNVNIEIMPVIGPDPIMCDIVIDRCAESDHFLEKKSDKASIIVAGRGASHKEALKEFNDFLSYFNDYHHLHEISGGFISLAQPDLTSSIKQQIQNGLDTFYIFPYLFYGGYLLTKLNKLVGSLQEEHPDLTFITLSPIGNHEHLIALIEKRVISWLSSY